MKNSNGLHVCTQCGKTENEVAFYPSNKLPDGLSSWCRPCNRLHVKAYRLTARGRERHRAAYHRMKADPKRLPILRARQHRANNSPGAAVRRKRFLRNQGLARWPVERKGSCKCPRCRNTRTMFGPDFCWECEIKLKAGVA